MTVPKRERMRLAKSELLMSLAAKVQEWADDVGDRSNQTRPFDEWESGGEIDPFHDLIRRYKLKPRDVVRACDQLAEEIEWRALRAGYERAWIDGDPGS